jgi:hypothetical protein
LDFDFDVAEAGAAVPGADVAGAPDYGVEEGEDVEDKDPTD